MPVLAPAKPASETSRSRRAASCQRYSSSSHPVSAPQPLCWHESSPRAPVDRLLRADRPSQTVPPTACPHRTTRTAPSSPPRITPSRMRFAQLARRGYFSRCPSLISVHTGFGRRPRYRPRATGYHGRRGARACGCGNPVCASPSAPSCYRTLSYKLFCTAAKDDGLNIPCLSRMLTAFAIVSVLGIVLDSAGGAPNQKEKSPSTAAKDKAAPSDATPPDAATSSLPSPELAAVKVAIALARRGE